MNLDTEGPNSSIVLSAEDKSRIKTTIWALLFTDDLKIASSVKTNEDIKDIQRALDVVYKWMSTNNMHVNSSKTFAMRTGNE